MRPYLLAVSLSLTLSCNNTTGTNEAAASPRSIAPRTETGGNCNNTIYFKKGSTIQSRTTDGKGKVLSLQQSTVRRVYTENNMTVAEVDMQSTEEKGSKPKTMSGIYRCDGTNMLMDLSSFIENKPDMTISSTGVPFPLNISAGDILPESKYTVTVKTGGREMKIHATIKDRKVEARQPITVAAGTFNCYRIHATIDAITEMEGMTEEIKQAMEKARANMPKNTMVIWFDPVVAVVKMEMYMGKNLLTVTELTSVSK